MKKSSSVVLIITAVCALFFATAPRTSAGQSEYYGSDAVLRIKHSPVLGINIPITVRINGALEGAFAKGHIFQRTLAPGRHTIHASRTGRPSHSYFGTLDVRPGETYSFVVKCTLNQVYLEPVSQVN